MADLAYGQPTVTLQDLIAQIAGQGGGAAPPPSSGLMQALTQAQGAQQGGGTLSPGADATMQELERQAFAPDPAAPEPVNVGFGQRLGLGLANALSAYGAGLQGRPGQDFLAAELARLQSEQGRGFRAQLSNADRKRAMAKDQLDEARKKQDSQQNEAQRQADKKDIIKMQQDQANLAREDAQAARADEFSHSAALQKELLKSKLDEAKLMQQERIKAQGDVDKAEARTLAKLDRAATGQGMQMVLGVKSNLPAALKQFTPEQIREQFSEAMDVLARSNDLKPGSRKDILDYFMEKVDPLLKVEESKRAAAEMQREYIQPHPGIDLLKQTMSPFAPQIIPSR